MPPYFAAVRSAWGPAVPLPDGQTFDVVAEAALLAAKIEQLTGKPVQLPVWEPVPGTLWRTVVAACGKRVRPVPSGVTTPQPKLPAPADRQGSDRRPRLAGSVVGAAGGRILDTPA